jgi:hypothetical protein
MVLLPAGAWANADLSSIVLLGAFSALQVIIPRIKLQTFHHNPVYELHSRHLPFL